MGVIILYRQELFYGPGGYSMGYHQGGHYFCKGSQYFLEKGSFFYRIMTWGLLFYRGSLYFVTPAHNKTNKCPVRLV